MSMRAKNTKSRSRSSIAAGGRAATTAARQPNGRPKPTYVEELERQLAEKDRTAQEYIAKYRQAASEFEESRLRLRREISKDIERGRREILADLLEVVDNLDRAIDAAGKSPSPDALLQGVEMVRRQFLSKLEGARRETNRRRRRAFDPLEARSRQHRAGGEPGRRRPGRRRRPPRLHDRRRCAAAGVGGGRQDVSLLAARATAVASSRYAKNEWQLATGTGN